jgi:hypothetical protein
MQEQLSRSGSFAYTDVGEGREQERKLYLVNLGFEIGSLSPLLQLTVLPDYMNRKASIISTK